METTIFSKLKWTKNNRIKLEKRCNYHFGTLKKASKNVCMPSLFSWIISANPKRKNERWRFLSWGHNVLQAEIWRICLNICSIIYGTLHSRTMIFLKSSRVNTRSVYLALMDCNLENLLANIVQNFGSLVYQISQKHILEPQTEIWPPNIL